MMRFRPLAPASLAAGLVLLPAHAVANGNVSHQWVSHDAIDRTPVGGSLYELVGDPDLRPMIDTGTMYPDWGYTPGATAEEREAGEASHWEPVQDGYRQWIMATYSPPWSDEARRHLAFYLGLGSHGIADQSYDSMFFERSRSYQGGDHGEFDQDTDVMWAATSGPGEPPRAWIPAAPLLELYQSLAGVVIDESSMEQQLGFVGVAIAAVNALAEDPMQVADAEADFPWAAEHDDDEATPGNPPHEAEIVRRYWRSNWSLLHGDPVPRPVLWSHPIDGGAGHPTDAASIESWVSLVFARALVGPEVDPSFFHLEDSTGAEVPLALDLFYGDGSHVVHLQPTVDLLPDEVYVVTVDPGLPTIHGDELEGWSLTFSTGARPVPPLHDDGFWDEPDPYGDEPAGTTGGSGGGDTDAATSDSTGRPDETGDVDATGATGGETGEGGDAGADGDAGCGCSQPGRGAPWILLGVIALAAPRRPRRPTSTRSSDRRLRPRSPRSPC